jgi:hypothetical protein
MKMKKYASFDEYFADQSPKNRSIIRTLRMFTKRVAPALQESVKWGNGCWLKEKIPIAYVYSAPDYVQFGFSAALNWRIRIGSSKARASTCGTSRCASRLTSTRPCSERFCYKQRGNPFTHASP